MYYIKRGFELIAEGWALIFRFDRQPDNLRTVVNRYGGRDLDRQKLQQDREELIKDSEILRKDWLI